MKVTIRKEKGKDGDIDNVQKEDTFRDEKRGNIVIEKRERKKSKTRSNDGDREKVKRQWIQRGRRYKGQRKGNRQGEKGN